MINRFLKTFFPWIVYYILGFGLGIDKLENSIITMFVFIIYGYKDIKDKILMSIISPIFLMMIILNNIYFKNGFLYNYPVALFYGCLFLMSLVSIIIKFPFTIQYARKETSSDKWNHPIFLKINYILSGYWTVIFGFAFIINLMNADYILARLSSVVFSISGILFSVYFPQWYRRKIKASQEACVLSRR